MGSLSFVNRVLLSVVLLLLLAVFSMQALAASWSIDNTTSRVNFISIKANTIAENHHFKQISGGLSADGQFSVDIDIASVDTLIEIRNQRMIDMLFEAAKFPKATLTAKVDMDALAAIGVGQQASMRLESSLELHGQSQTMPVQVRVARLADKQLLVTSEQPLLLNADAYNMSAGVEKLREVAGLPSISPAVPVSFVISLTSN
ncbi:YceI family protein [Paraferrimonas haliotis]|nr:YceI family protein [Paraferrimonas haliotis]